MEQLKASARYFFTTTVFTQEMWRIRVWGRYLVLMVGFLMSPYVSGAMFNDYSLTPHPDSLVNLWVQGSILGVLTFSCAFGLLCRFLPELRQSTLIAAQKPDMQKTVMRLDQLFSCTVVVIAMITYCIEMQLR